MGQLEMFGQNIVFLLGALLFLGLASVALLVVYIALRVWIFRALQRRSQQAYLQRSRRADGKLYPPISFGACDACGRVSTTIYHPATGPALCSPCYEDYWRREERQDRANTNQPRVRLPQVILSKPGQSAYTRGSQICTVDPFPNCVCTEIAPP